MSALLDVQISQRGGANPQRVQTNGVSCSWGVDSPGALSCELELKDYHRLGIRDARGYWIQYQHPTAGAFGGTITDTQPSAEGVIELAAGDWGSTLLDARRLPWKVKPSNGQAGSLATRVLTEIQAQDDALWIDDIYADEYGESISLPWDRQDALSALDGLASASGQSWWIDPLTRNFYWRVRRGEDLSGQIQLVAGRHISNWSLPRSIDPIRNDILMVPDFEQYAITQAVVVEDAASIVQFGRRQDERTSRLAVTEASLRPIAAAELRRLALLGASASMSVLNVDSCWSWFREGDSIMVLVPEARARVTLRVLARAIDTDDDVMDVSGIVEAWQDL